MRLRPREELLIARARMLDVPLTADQARGLLSRYGDLAEARKALRDMVTLAREGQR